MKIKKLLPQQTEEIEINLPAYYKKSDYFYKINENEIPSMFHALPTNMLILTRSNESAAQIVEYEKITEQEWNAALKQLANHFGQFMCNNGLTECGYPLPEPKDFEPQEEAT